MASHVLLWGSWRALILSTAGSVALGTLNLCLEVSNIIFRGKQAEYKLFSAAYVPTAKRVGPLSWLGYI